MTWDNGQADPIEECSVPATSAADRLCFLRRHSLGSGAGSFWWGTGRPNTFALQHWLLSMLRGAEIDRAGGFLWRGQENHHRRPQHFAMNEMRRARYVWRGPRLAPSGKLASVSCHFCVYRCLVAGLGFFFSLWKKQKVFAMYLSLSAE